MGIIHTHQTDAWKYLDVWTENGLLEDRKVPNETFSALRFQIISTMLNNQDQVLLDVHSSAKVSISLLQIVFKPGPEPKHYHYYLLLLSIFSDIRAANPPRSQSILADKKRMYEKLQHGGAEY